MITVATDTQLLQYDGTLIAASDVTCDTELRGSEHQRVHVQRVVKRNDLRLTTFDMQGLGLLKTVPELQLLVRQPTYNAAMYRSIAYMCNTARNMYPARRAHCGTNTEFLPDNPTLVEMLNAHEIVLRAWLLNATEGATESRCSTNINRYHGTAPVESVLNAYALCGVTALALTSDDGKVWIKLLSKNDAQLGVAVRRHGSVEFTRAISYKPTDTITIYTLSCAAIMLHNMAIIK